jgi:ssDNA-binding Zn-finger/Zn-ribbon topoisomerase 1
LPNKKASAKDDPSIIADAEIPDCKNCGGKTIFNRGRYGAWVVCMDCENKETLKNF